MSPSTLAGAVAIGILAAVGVVMTCGVALCACVQALYRWQERDSGRRIREREQRIRAAREALARRPSDGSGYWQEAGIGVLRCGAVGSPIPGTACSLPRGHSGIHRDGPCCWSRDA